MARMTGRGVANVRRQLGLDAVDFARVLGVHFSTVYRWERASVVQAEPLQQAILSLLAKRFRERPAAWRRELGRVMRVRLCRRGSLAALATLLVHIGAQGEELPS